MCKGGENKRSGDQGGGAVLPEGTTPPIFPVANEILWPRLDQGPKRAPKKKNAFFADLCGKNRMAANKKKKRVGAGDVTKTWFRSAPWVGLIGH